MDYQLFPAVSCDAYMYYGYVSNIFR